MTTPTLLTHDLLISDNASPVVTIGLFFVKDKNGLPIFQNPFRQPADSLSQQQFQSLSQAIFPPQYQGFITQKTWHGGFGKQQLTGLGTDNQYMQTHGVDCSVKGLKYPSPLPVATTNTTATYSTSATIANGDFEAAGSWTYNSPWARSASAAQAGSWGARMTSGGPVVFYQGITAADSGLFHNGLTVTVTYYARYTTDYTFSASIRNNVDAGGATLLNHTPTLTGSWAQYTLQGSLSDGADQLYLVFEGTTTGTIDVDTVVITITDSITTSTAPNTIVKMFDFNNNHYLISDSGLWKRTAANWVRVAGSPSDIVDAASDGTNLFLARGFTKNTWYMDTSENMSEIAGTDEATSRCSKLAWINGFMYGITSATNLRKFTSITAKTVTANYTIGQAGYNVTALVNHKEMPYVVKENWAGYLDTSLATPAIIDIATELASLFNTNTGKNAISWRGNGAQVLYIPAGGGASLLVYDDGDVVNVGPDVIAERLGDFTGQIVAVTSDDQWLYMVLDNSTKIEILKGRYETIDGATSFRLHSIFEDTYTTVGYAHISSITAKRLYYGGGTALPKYIPLPTKYGDPLNDTTLGFNTAVTDESSWYDVNLPRISKTYLNVTVDSLGLNANRTITIEYQLWESQGTWTELGGSGNGVFNTSPTQTKTFAINIGGRKIRFRATYTTNDTAVGGTGFGMIEFTARLALAPTRLDLFMARVRVGNKNTLKNTGALDSEMTYPVVAAQLHAWKHTQPLLITFNDGLFDSSGTLDGKTLEVKFMEGYPKEIPISLQDTDPKGMAAESLFDLALVSIDRSVS